MSHFNVAVFTTDDSLGIDELLAPYDEDIVRAPYIEYTKQEAIDFARKNYPQFAGRTDEECWKFMAEGCTTDRKGNIYSTANTDAHYDYWLEGGRWKGFLKLKGSGQRVNSARIKDIDFSLDKEVYEKALHFWDVVVEHKPLAPDEEMPFSYYNEDYYREFYGDRETYARRQAQFSTFAVVTSDGIWLEKGSCGWFGWSDETPEEAQDWEDNYIKNFIENTDPDTVLTIVDCHI